MSNVTKALCIKRNQLEMQLERNEEKGGECIVLTKGECEELIWRALAFVNRAYSDGYRNGQNAKAREIRKALYVDVSST